MVLRWEGGKEGGGGVEGGNGNYLSDAIPTKGPDDEEFRAAITHSRRRQRGAVCTDGVCVCASLQSFHVISCCLDSGGLTGSPRG